MLQVNTPAVIEHVAAAVPPSTVQLVPGFVGNTSVTVTPCAVPAPVLVTVSVNPIGSPAFTVPASGVLTIWMLAQFTVIDAVDWSLPSLDVVTLPVLSTSG